MAAAEAQALGAKARTELELALAPRLLISRHTNLISFSGAMRSSTMEGDMLTAPRACALGEENIGNKRAKSTKQIRKTRRGISENSR